MKQQSTLKKILIKIKNIIILIIITIIGLIKKFFNIDNKNNIKQKIEPKENTEKIIKETKIDVSPIGTLPDEDNIKSNPHQSETSSEDSINDIILELPKIKYEKIKNNNKKDEEEKLTVDELLNNLVIEELEDIYKEEKFKVKKAPKEIKEKIEEIKERILPKIKKRVENNIFRNEEEIRKEVRIKLEEDLIEYPIFPKLEEKNNDNIYSVAYKVDNKINIKTNTIQNKRKENVITTLNDKEKIATKLNETNVIMVQNIEEIPTSSLNAELKNTALAVSITAAGIAKEIITSDTKKEEKETKKERISNESEKELLDNKEQRTSTNNEETIKENKEKKPEEDLEEKQLEELQKEVEEKIKKIQKEKQKEEEKKEELINEKEIIALGKTGDSIIEESLTEIKKEEFEDKNYDKIERQIDKMLEDITNTYLRYEDKLTDKQKKKLQQEEEKLRKTKKNIQQQKNKDITYEIEQLSNPITEEEIEGLKNELNNLQKQNESEVNEEFLRKIDKLEGMTKEQVSKVDKRILLKRFNKANILLEMTSLLALPFVRNKYFFYFTVGLVVDNHFNFINAFFNRKMNKYEPVDLSQIKKGQDALNGALDITYKNIVELEYLEQRAINKYPELIYDPRFISQVTKLKTQLNSKYNKLMKKNKTMEKYYGKTKKHIKILKPEQQKNANQN